MRFGFAEIALVLVLVLLMFGGGRISKVMSEFGKGLRGFKDGLKGEGESDEPKNIEGQG